MTSRFASSFVFCIFYRGARIKEMDDYAEDGGPGEVSLLCSFTMSLCAHELKQRLISLLFQIIRL